MGMSTELNLKLI